MSFPSRLFVTLTEGREASVVHLPFISYTNESFQVYLKYNKISVEFYKIKSKVFLMGIQLKIFDILRKRYSAR